METSPSPSPLPSPRIAPKTSPRQTTKSTPSKKATSKQTKLTSTPSKESKASDDEDDDEEGGQVERWKWMVDIRDKNKKRPGDPDYDPTSLYIPDDAFAKLSKTQQQYWTIKKEHFDTVIFFQQGFFYNVFERDADICHKELGWRYTHGNKRINNYTAGVNISAWGPFASALFNKGYKVAKIDQMETKPTGTKTSKSSSNKTTEKRTVSRVLTQGTAVDEALLTKDTNYLLSFKEEERDGQIIYGVCLVDASVGEFSVGYFDDDKYRSHFGTLLYQTLPKELIYERGHVSKNSLAAINGVLSNPILNSLAAGSEFPDSEQSYDYLVSYFDMEDNWPECLHQFKDNSVVMSALGACIFYLRKIVMDKDLLNQRNFRQFSLHDQQSTMLLDGQTLKNLEILINDHGKTVGTLLTVMDHTVTPFGKRMFRKWICHPLLKVDEIMERQNAVATFLENPDLVENVTKQLYDMPDLERKISRIHTGKVNLETFLLVLEGYKRSQSIMKMLQSFVQRNKIVGILGKLTGKSSEIHTIDPLLQYFDGAIDMERSKTEELFSAIVDLGLETIDEEQPKISTMEKRSLLLKEHLFEVMAGSLSNDKAERRHSSADLKLPQYLLSPKISPYKRDEEDMSMKRKKSESFLSMSHRKKPSVTEVTIPNEVEEEEEDDIVEEEEEGVTGQKPRWSDIKPGVYLMVGKRENINNGRSDWVSEMDKTIGLVGLVKAKDSETKQVLLSFYEGDTASSYEWWYAKRVLIVPEKVTKDPFQQLSAGSQDDLVALANKTNKALSVLYARQAISYLMGSLPTNVLSVSMLGGPQKLTNMVKLVITEWAAAKDKNNSIIRRADPVKRHLSKLTALLKQEAVSNILPRDRRIERKSKNEILVPQKAGYLTKQGQLLKAWKRQWFVLQGNYLSYFKSPGSLDPLGVIDIQDTIVAEPIYLPKSKLRDFCFRLVTSRRIFILKASTPKDKLEWINLIESARLLSPVRNSMSPMTSRPSDQSLAWLLTRQAVKQLNNTVDMDVPYIMETSPQPFPAKIKIKKMIKFEGAERLIVVFDRNSKIGKYDMLRFFKDVGMRESIASFSYRGPNSFPPTIVESDRFWLSFTSEAANKGYKFYVMPLSIKQTDDVLLNKPSFDFGLSLVEWLLSLVPVWAKSFYCTEVYNALVGHVTEPYRPQKLDVRMKVFANLTKLLRRYREFPPESQLDLSRIRNLKVEMLELYHEEREGGEILLSSYLQRLVELQMQLEIVELTQRDDAVRNKSEVHHDEIQVENFKKSTPVKREEQRSKRTSKEEKKILKELESKKKKDDKKEVSKSNVDGSWFEESLSTFKLMIQLVRGENFPAIFVRQSCYSVLKKAVTEESPHPYPPGVRVTSTVHIPDAESLMVTFDPRCHTEPNVDTLMFSKLYVGGDELGVFSGEFKQQSPFIIPGNRFIWSFISESTSPGLWGFRFTVTPIFPEELQQEMEESCERDYRQMLSIFEDWTLASDHELVRFVQSSCEKLRISFREFSFDRFDSSDIQCYPMICDFPIQAIECRLRILKSFNTSVSMLLPLIDMRNISEEWSMAFLISTLRGLLFYDIKVGYISDILSRDATNLRRPLVSLNRQEEALKEECLFLQGFSELSKIDTVRLHQNERAFEVKLEKEGAEDVGGPYLECISQFCQDIQSKELGLFIMCPNGKEEIGFNQDKFVPSPQSTSAIRLEQFEFVGKILGIAIRTKNVLDLSLPSVLWKPLVGMRIDRSDLEAIDKCCCQFLDSIRNISKEGVTEENFNDIIFETMTTQSADGRVVELKPGGTNVAVTWQNRMEFVSLVEQYRMNEFNLQIDAIARGLSSVVPIHLLSLFSWQELEFRVCGRPGIDLDMLEKHTEYCSVNSTDRHVQDFWQVMRSFTAEEQALFLRFVSGRSRLPPENEFTTPFKLHAFTKASDGYEDGFLPEAQTCFFSLALPSYSSQQIMKERLLYAINTCKEIDTDFVVPDHNFIPSEEDVSEVDDASDSESETIEDSNCANQ
eukprot:TRINITY_DN2538_c2_g1_i6.p1 TRINITY_DN2538_c2_g1~~TRINITY_DN2538_c2_g1_i6.p1  ORF type:complete len:2218 (-),score=665.69 TRINITY_DN2538_c2_g1_i6:11-6022(-)